MIRAIAFDFETRTERALAVDGVAAERQAGRYCWVDVGDEPPEVVKPLLTGMLGLSARAVEAVVGADEEGRFDIHEDCLHVGLTEMALREGGFDTLHVDIVLARGLLVTFHRRPTIFLDRVWNTHQEDFVRFARSPGFLLYELGDALLASHRRQLRLIGEWSDQVQGDLMDRRDERVFVRVSDLTRNLLLLRKVVLAARDVLHEWAARRSAFISETTQPYLENLSGSLDRLADDVGAEREAMNDLLNLYIGMVGHRTNRIMARLTVLSSIFMPLTFVCGVYGMNLIIPETEWRWTYPLFWGLTIVFAGVSLLIVRRRGWLR